MCGIVALVSSSGRLTKEHRGVFLKSLSMVAHRGEFRFQNELFQFGNCLLGTNRLAFTSGFEPQPAVSPDRQFAVLLNGELYAFHGSAGQSDTAALAAALERNTAAALDVDGIYAAIALDMRAKALWIARDAFGVKPLYYARTRLGLIIASEVKALAIHDFIDEIIEVPPASTIRFSLADLSSRKLAHRKAFQPDKKYQYHDIREFADALRNELNEAVREQTRDGKRYAIFLSGGLDSSSIYALCKRQRADVIPIVLGTPSSTDVRHARLLCKDFGQKLVVVPCPPEAELSRILHTVIHHCESFEPNVVRQSALSWILAQAAHSYGCRVALCGEGADELFGGYPEFGFRLSSFEHVRRQFLADLHRTQLQRIDRMNMATTIEVRVPFLSRRVSKLALSNVRHEMYLRARGKFIETKRVLRLAMNDLLSKQIIERPKVVLSEGAGVRGNDPRSGLFSDITNNILSDKEFADIRNRYKAWSLNSKEEALYFRIFASFGYHKLKGSRKRVVANSIRTLS